MISDVVLSDGESGMTVAQEARKLRGDLRILFISGYPKGAIGGRSLLDEGASVLTKPFTVADLAREARLALDRKE